MFVVLIRYKRPLEEIDAAMKPHMAFLRDCYKKNLFVASGRRVPRTGGVILARAESPEALAEVMQRDPFVSRGLADFEIIEFRTSQVAEEFKALADPK